MGSITSRWWWNRSRESGGLENLSFPWGIFKTKYTSKNLRYWEKNKKQKNNECLNSFVTQPEVIKGSFIKDYHFHCTGLAWDGLAVIRDRFHVSVITLHPRTRHFIVKIQLLRNAIWTLQTFQSKLVLVRAPKHQLQPFFGDHVSRRISFEAFQAAAPSSPWVYALLGKLLAKTDVQL